jgi:hypothetical protein
LATFAKQNQSSRTRTADDEAHNELWQMSEHFALISFLDCLSEQESNHCGQGAIFFLRQGRV